MYQKMKIHSNKIISIFLEFASKPQNLKKTLVAKSASTNLFSDNNLGSIYSWTLKLQARNANLGTAVLPI